jgi:two-component system response regulator BaeR
MDKDLIPQALFVEGVAPIARSRAMADGSSFELTPVEARLFDALASHPGRIFARCELLGSLYPDHRVVCERTVDAHVKNLRRKLRARHARWSVKASYGKGYSLTAAR